MPQGAAQIKLLTEVASQWTRRDAKAAQSWLETLSEGPARNAALSGFGDGLACGRPEEAASFVAALPPGDLQSETALKVVERWACDDPASAAAWAVSFPPGTTREQALAKVIKEWRADDRYAADAWLQQANLPPETKERLLRK